MEDIVVPVVAIGGIFVGLPWIILHYMTKWKTAATLTNSDEALLEELYQLARRLDDRMQTVERLVSSEHPDFQPLGSTPGRNIDSNPLHDVSEGLDRLRGQFERSRR
jgi:phage shock protein B